MRIADITARALHIPFKVAFTHAGASRTTTQSILAIALAQEGGTRGKDAPKALRASPTGDTPGLGRPCAGVGEGCPREYVTGESVASALAFVAAHRHDWLSSIRDVATLSEWVERHRAVIDAAPAAWAAVELALLDLIGQLEGRPVESLLGLMPLAGCFRYTAVLGDGTTATFHAQLDNYLRAGFRDFKIKLGEGPHPADRGARCISRSCRRQQPLG